MTGINSVERGELLESLFWSTMNQLVKQWDACNGQAPVGLLRVTLSFLRLCGVTVRNKEEPQVMHKKFNDTVISLEKRKAYMAAVLDREGNHRSS